MIIDFNYINKNRLFKYYTNNSVYKQKLMNFNIFPAKLRDNFFM